MVLLAALFVLPLTFWLTTRASRRNGGTRGLRWHGIRWERPEESDELDAIVAEAHSKHRSGDLGGALRDYGRALALKRSALVLNNRGCALLESGEVERAIADLEEAVALEPESATAHCSLAEAYARAGDDAKALASLRTAAGLDPRWREHAKTAAPFERLRSSPEGAKWLAEE